MRTSADIRRLNSFDVVRALHASGASSRREIVAATDLSFATVAVICSELIERGIVAEMSQRRGGSGRPTTTLALNPAHGAVLGVDIAETYVHVEAYTTSLESLSRTTLELDLRRRDPEDVVARVREAIGAEVAALGGRTLRAVGVSAPGQVDRAGGTSVFAPNWDWHDVPLIELLADSVDAPLWLDNPLKALAVAELWSHAERGHQDFAVLNLGTGLGAGIAIEGKLLRGQTNSAGEWGHTVVVADGRVCRCGSRGCVEAYVGAPGIIQTLRESHPESPLSPTDDQTDAITELAEAFAAADPVAVDVVESTAHYLGIAVATLVNMLNPEIVLLGGWVSRDLGSALLERALPHIRRHALTVPMAAATFELQDQRANIVSLGVAALALESYLSADGDSEEERASD